MGRGRGRDRKRLQHDRSIDRSFCACAFQRSHAKTHSVLCTTACSFPSVARTSPCVHTTDKSCVLWPQTNKKEAANQSTEQSQKVADVCVYVCVCVPSRTQRLYVFFVFQTNQKTTKTIQKLFFPIPLSGKHPFF